VANARQVTRGQRLQYDGACRELREAIMKSADAGWEVENSIQVRRCALHAVKLEGGDYEWVQTCRLRATSVHRGADEALGQGDDGASASTPARRRRCVQRRSWPESAPRKPRWRSPQAPVGARGRRKSAES